MPLSGGASAIPYRRILCSSLHHISAKLDELDNVIAVLNERRNQLALQRNALYLLEVFRAVPELYMLVLRGSVTYKCDAIGKYYPSWRLHVRAALSSHPERIELFGAAMDIHPERGIEDAALALSELLEKTPLSEQISELGEKRADRTFRS